MRKTGFGFEDFSFKVFQSDDFNIARNKIKKDDVVEQEIEANEVSDSSFEENTPRLSADDEESKSEETFTPQSNSTSQPGRKRKRKCLGFKRWGRKDDRILFKNLRDLETQGIISIEEFCQLPCRDPETLANHPQYELVLNLAKDSGWRGYLPHMVQRIQNIYKDQGFSVREVKYFKKIVKPLVVSGYIDYETVLHEFPGKRLESVKSRIVTIYKKKIEKMNRKGLVSKDSNLNEFIKTKGDLLSSPRKICRKNTKTSAKK